MTDHQVFYPALLDISGKSCVIVGGGAVAERKARSMLAAGAKLTVISPSLSAGLLRLKLRGAIIHHSRRYREGDLRGAMVVIAATSDAEVNRRIATDADCLVNVVDQPKAGNMISPSIIRRGMITFTVATGGVSPAAVKTIRKELQEYYPKSFGPYIRLIGKLRKQALATIKDRKTREKLFRELASAPMFEQLRVGGFRQTAARARALYEKYRKGML
jgi:precorrin-2 dehydrogenase/sirohydrochlorin ferrochelatase